MTGLVWALLALLLAPPAWAGKGAKGKLRPSSASKLRLRRGRAAALDLGSNSVKLIVTNRRGKVVYDAKLNTALGQGVGTDKLLPPANQKRVMSAVRKLVEAAEKHKVPASKIRLVATAAVRNATGKERSGAKLGKDELSGKTFLSQLAKDFGIGRAAVLSGKQEAEHGYRGAIIAWPSARLRKVLGRSPARIAVFDTGGGSHQVSVGSQKVVLSAGSRQIGSHYVRDVLMGGATSINAKGLAAVDKRLVEAVDKLPISKRELRGAQPMLTGGFAKFLRLYLGREVITVKDVRDVRKTLAGLDKDRRREHILQRVAANKRAAAKGELALSAKRLVKEAESLGFVGQGKSGRSLPAKASLLLRILDLAGYGEGQRLLLSGTDTRHYVING